MANGLRALTEKEKQTLRLVVTGYDAKSMARHLGLSVHTVNERLREARRKLEVSSSREAARLLLARESPQSFGDKQIGEGTAATSAHNKAPPAERARSRVLPVLAGVVAMTVILAALSLAALPGAVPSADVPVAVTAPTASEATARGWLEMIDRADWAGSYAATTRTFQGLNTLATWTAVSEKVRAPLGAVRGRTLVSNDIVPTPQGYQLVKFRTAFAGRNALETVSLVREDGAWKVAGVVVD